MQTSLQTYQFKPDEVIASIGAGGGLWEVGFASTCDNLTFYLQDIQESLLNASAIEEAILFWEKQNICKITAQFYPVIGTETATNLPVDIFDKVLIINALHEFSFPEIILKDVYQILKTNGKLFIEETLAQQPKQIHEGCGKPLFTENELIALLHSQQFVLTKIVEREPFWKIFEFEKA